MGFGGARESLYCRDKWSCNAAAIRMGVSVILTWREGGREGGRVGEIGEMGEGGREGGRDGRDGGGREGRGEGEIEVTIP